MWILFTFSLLLVRKLVQPWFNLGVLRSGREPRYLPSESYLGYKEVDVNYHDDVPVHLPMIATGGTIAPNHDELTLIVGDCTGSCSTMLKIKLLPACN